MSEKLSEILSKAATRKQQSQTSVSSKPADSNSLRLQKKFSLYTDLADLYSRMEQAYTLSAQQAGLNCADCDTNCCTSYFQHHTHVEWAYLWRGLLALPADRRKDFLERARLYRQEAAASLAANVLPTAMCPLNEDGLCALYSHRLMICRLHGTRNTLLLPDGRQQIFPGCARFTTLPCSQAESCPCLDRTPFYQELASLELRFRQKAGRALPRVNLTLAEMLVLGPPDSTSRL